MAWVMVVMGVLLSCGLLLYPPKAYDSIEVSPECGVPLTRLLVERDDYAPGRKDSDAAGTFGETTVGLVRDQCVSKIRTQGGSGLALGAMSIGFALFLGRRATRDKRPRTEASTIGV